MKYCVADGKIKFYTHMKDGQYFFEVQEGAVEIEQPPPELIERLEGKTFRNYSHAKEYIEDGEVDYLKERLAENDYKIIKSFEYHLANLEPPYDIFQLHEQRQALRDRINLLEGEIYGMDNE